MADRAKPSSDQPADSTTPTKILWSSAPPAPHTMTRLGAPSATLDAIDALLRWTEGLDDERAISLWAGLAASEDAATREAALLRWVDWAGVTVPLGLKLRDLVRAVEVLLGELAATARDPARVHGYTAGDRAPMTRALLGWMRAREQEPGAVLGAARALALAAESHRASAPQLVARGPEGSGGGERESLELVVGDATRARLSTRDLAGDPEGILVAALRRRVAAAGSDEADGLLEAYLRAERPAALPGWAETALDFLLLEGDLDAAPARALAALAAAAPDVWLRAAHVEPGASPRDALRAARLLAALGAHPDVAAELSPGVADGVVARLTGALGHPRYAVWSRAARAVGRLAGSVPGLAERLSALLSEPTEAGLRLRAHAALGGLSPMAPVDLARRRRALCDAADPALVAALSVGLADLDPAASAEWADLAALFAQKGGPEAWVVLARGLREVATRHPAARARVAPLAEDLRARAEAVGAGGDAETAERAAVLAARAAAVDAVTSPWDLLARLARAVGRDPAAPSLRGDVAAFTAELGAQVAGAVRAAGQESPRAAVRGCVLLEEVVDVLVEGDLAVVAGRLPEGVARAAALEAAEALRARLLRAAWAGLRRPVPAAFSWRRWLLRAAATLPRVAPAGRADAHAALREQAFETLERVADDPLLGRAGLQRYVAGAVEDLADAAGVSPVAALAWMAVRGAGLPARSRMRRTAGDGARREALGQLYALVEAWARPGRDPAADARALAALAGPETSRLGAVLEALARECEALAARRPEPHWSGLPRFDLADLANLADTVARVRDDAGFALTRDGGGAARPRAGEALADAAGRLNRMLTATSLKFVDATRRAEIAEHYASELAALCEAVATACGPLLGAGVRALLARPLVAVRALAAEAGRGREDGARYIARLRVLRPLDSAHEGGMATTYLAEGPAPGKRVVVKLLPWARFRGASAAVARAMFEGEMERLAPIVHPNIVSIVDAGCVDEGAYIALEYIPGASLETLLRRHGRLGLHALGPVVRDVARALAHLHARGIVHRDIKPGNVLAQYDVLDEADALDPARAPLLRAVVIDFGIATEATRRDAEGGVVGTPGYIAPEAARGLDLVTPALDVYSLAVVIYEMLTGVNPYLDGGVDVPTVLVRHGTMALPWKALPTEAATPALVQLLTEASRFDPRLRPTMREFLARWVEATEA